VLEIRLHHPPRFLIPDHTLFDCRRLALGKTEVRLTFAFFSTPINNPKALSFRGPALFFRLNGAPSVPGKKGSQVDGESSLGDQGA